MTSSERDGSTITHSKMADPEFRVWSSFPDAPFASRLITNALKAAFPTRSIETSPSCPLGENDEIPSTQPFLQWSTYDSLSHQLTLSNPSTVLSSSYTIRKSLIRKHFLHQALKSYTTKHPDSYLSTHQGSVPQTWAIDISFADELDEMWSDDLWELGCILDENEECEDEKERKWFILKPSMSDRGQGIRLFDSKESLTTIFESFEEDEDEEEDNGDGAGADTNVIASQLRHFVIQVCRVSCLNS